jgi:hypothetical protein
MAARGSDTVYLHSVLSSLKSGTHSKKVCVSNEEKSLAENERPSKSSSPPIYICIDGIETRTLRLTSPHYVNRIAVYSVDSPLGSINVRSNCTLRLPLYLYFTSNSPLITSAQVHAFNINRIYPPPILSQTGVTGSAPIHVAASYKLILLRKCTKQMAYKKGKGGKEDNKGESTPIPTDEEITHTQRENKQWTADDIALTDGYVKELTRFDYKKRCGDTRW